MYVEWNGNMAVPLEASFHLTADESMMELDNLSTIKFRGCFMKIEIVWHSLNINLRC